MKTKRIIKLFSLLMVILILISSLPLSIFAEETNPEDAMSYTQDKVVSDEESQSESPVMPFWLFILLVIFTLPSTIIHAISGVYISFIGIFEEIFTFLANIWNSIFG